MNLSNYHELITFILYRKSMISILTMKCASKWVRIIICFQSNDTKKRRKYKMHYYCRKKKRPNNPKWLRLRTNKRNSWITRELDKKTKWKIKLVCNQRDWHKWKLLKSKDAKLWWQEKITKIGLILKSILEMLRWTK